MRFERTKGSLVNLASGEISADALLDMLVRTTQDVYEANHITRASALNVTDQKALLMNLYNLSTTVLTIFQTNQDAVSQFPGFIQNKIRGSMEALSEKEQILADINEEIRREEANQNRLTEACQETEKRRSHLLTVKEDCVSLQRRIDELNDARLDEMAKEKQKLEEERKLRETRAQSLSQQKAELQAELEAAQNRVRSVQDQICTRQKELEEQVAAERQAQTDLTEIKTQIEEISVNLEQLQTQLQEIPKRNTQMMEAYREAKTKLTMLRNAINAARNDMLLPGNLLSDGKNGGAFQIFENADLEVAQREITDWDELIQWFEDMEQRVSSLLEVYRSAVAAMVAKAETLTSQKT